MRTRLLAVLLLLGTIGRAQDTLPDIMDDHAYFGPIHFANSSDSADFMHFRRGLRMVQRSDAQDTMKVQYRMVWREDQHGGFGSVSRVDSSVWQPPEKVLLGLFMGGPFVTADGRRGMLVVHDTPCGLICRNAWYYVEE